MAQQSVVFIFDAHLPFLRGCSDMSEMEEVYLFDVMSSTYLPLLRLLSQFEEESLPVKIGIAFSPCLCGMFTDTLLQTKYIARLTQQIEFGTTEIERLKADAHSAARAREFVDLLKTNLHDFTVVYEKNVLNGFNHFIAAGMIELLATTASSCFLPLYADIPESVAAQIEVGFISSREFFSAAPAGFWLPALAYAPGLENSIKSYGFEYTVVDTPSFLLANPMPRTGVFAPAITQNKLKVLARDLRACAEVGGNEHAYYARDVYLDIEKDVGFELQNDAVSRLFPQDMRRCPSGFRYWDRSGKHYDAEAAEAQLQKDAAAFVENRRAVFSTLEKETDFPYLSSVFSMQSHFFGYTWFEGVRWFELVCRRLVQDANMAMEFPGKVVQTTKQLQQTELFYSSDLPGGYATKLLQHSNDWMYASVRKATQRMIQLANNFPNDTGLRERMLNMAARDVLLAQSMYWQLLSGDDITKDYAKQRFKEHINAFTVVFDALGSGMASTSWLIRREKEFPLFSYINYRVFSTKQ